MDSQLSTPVATGKDVTIHAMQLTAWNGALPPLEMAKAYEEICKRAFERILVAAFAGAIACAALGCEKAAMVFVGATVVNLAATFIGRKSK